MFLIVGVLYSLPWFRSEVTLYRWDSIVRFSVNIWLLGELVSGTVVFLRHYESGEKRKDWTLIFLNLALGAGVVASAGAYAPAHHPSPVCPCWACSKVCLLKRGKVGRRRLWLWQTNLPININKHIFSKTYFWLLQFCILDKLCIFYPVVEPFPLLFVCLWVPNCLSVRQYTK